MDPAASHSYYQAGYGGTHTATGTGRQSMDANRSIPSPPVSAGYFPSLRNENSVNNPYTRRPISRPYETGSSASGLPLAAGAATPGASTPHDFTPDANSSHHSMRSLPNAYAMGPVDSHYDDSPYWRPGGHSNQAVHDADIHPHNIIDDGDDGFMPEPKRKSMLPLSRERSRSREKLGKGGATAGVAASGAATGGLFGRKAKNVTSSGSYNAVSASEATLPEKSEWLARQTVGKRRMRWILGAVIGTVIVLAVIGGIVGGVLGTKSSSGGGGGNSDTNNAAADTAANGDLNINSPEIKRLLNNKDLHKVFPGMDYTPWGVQYPLCLEYPPSQNNVTRDMAVISQLTNAVRLYGTDCNQTEMVLHSIDRLQLTDMKVWLGVWIDPNATTTQRQLDQMYKILAEVPDRSIFAGVIIGNEALYRAGEDKAQSEQELIDYLTDARANFTSLGYDLSISTSDLGDNWSGTLVAASDYVMSNVHPFFAGVNVDNAASWTWDFWQSHDVVLTSTNTSRQIIAETGWPSGGGTDCGNEQNVCAAGDTGSVASVENMNTFMNDWVCQALANGTHYFWFEAFDEAWKVVYNTVSRLRISQAQKTNMSRSLGKIGKTNGA